MGAALRNVAIWLILFAIPVTGWAFRDELGDVVNRVHAVLVPGTPIATGLREVTIARSSSSGFVVDAAVNGRKARFVFDTGASVVVLTPETARAAGIDTGRLRYDQTVLTANGRTQAAAVRLDTVAVGDIVERNVPALVSRPGDLFENLLGMSFLSRLDSYQVSGQRLVLRGRS
jgi:aspartyl protease family protein